VTDNLGNTILIYSAKVGDIKTARYILDLGADVNFQNSEGDTAMHFARYFGFPMVIELLLSYNASEDIRNY